MKANADRRQGIRNTAALIATFTLLSIAGCKSEDAGQALSTSLGDLARQLLTFWIL